MLFIPQPDLVLKPFSGIIPPRAGSKRVNDHTAPELRVLTPHVVLWSTDSVRSQRRAHRPLQLNHLLTWAAERALRPAPLPSGWQTPLAGHPAV